MRTFKPLPCSLVLCSLRNGDVSHRGPQQRASGQATLVTPVDATVCLGGRNFAQNFSGSRGSCSCGMMPFRILACQCLDIAATSCVE